MFCPNLLKFASLLGGEYISYLKTHIYINLSQFSFDFFHFIIHFQDLFPTRIWIFNCIAELPLFFLKIRIKLFYPSFVRRKNSLYSIHLIVTKLQLLYYFFILPPFAWTVVIITICIQTERNKS